VIDDTAFVYCIISSDLCGVVLIDRCRGALQFSFDRCSYLLLENQLAQPVSNLPILPGDRWLIKIWRENM
jgi:hypothetical protein